MNQQPESEAGTSRRLTPLAALRSRSRNARVWDEEDRVAVLNELFFEGPERAPFLARFGSLIILSTAIAGFGLIADSAAVVIGAMLVAPLMTPILATAGALVHGQVQRLVTSVAILVGGIVFAIATGWILSWLVPGTMTATELTGELLARTNPSLLDLGIAIAAGLAGGYVLTHPRAGSSLPGVAIAVALVPPLATVGICLQLGAPDRAQGAFLLFGTNLFAIILSAMVMMLASGFVPPDVRQIARGRVRIGLVVSALALAGVAIPLSLHTREVLADQSFTRRAIAAIQDWDPSGRIVDLQADSGPGGGTVDLVMASSGEPAPAWRLAERLATTVGFPVEVTVQYRLETRDAATADAG